MSFFPTNTLELDNPQSREEDEELEEQRRRQEELTDLLATGIHAFNYDESTINSSVTSVEGTDQNYVERLRNEKESILNTSPISVVLEENYRDADQKDQLKVLYEVRGREIKNLLKEFDDYKEEKLKEISILKNKVTLSEAEIRHLQISLSNAENLLVDKTGTIKSLKNDASLKDEEIENLRKVNEELKFEICTYASTVSELQLKLSNTNPFNADRKYKSDELQKVQQDQISKLESQLQEQSKKIQILDKQKSYFEEEMKKLIKHQKESEEENNLTIKELSKKLQSSQQQCRDLYLLGEAIKKESDHFKERIQELEKASFNLSGDDTKIKKMGKESLLINLEKLKRMLLDKDIELNTLRTKLKLYNSDLEELFEYREILNKMYSYEAKPCSNLEHEELLIFMQRQLQSYQQAVEDRNNQIISLNVVNKELQEKIEEMIEQTRTDIQNISQKYSLPQLETMSNELQNAEETINSLEKQLVEKNELLKTLQQKLVEAQNLYQLTVNEKQKFEKLNMELKFSLEKMEDERNNLRKINGEIKESQSRLIEENKEIKSSLQKDTTNSDIFILELKNHILDYMNLLENRELGITEIKDKLKQWNSMMKNFLDIEKNNGSNTSKSKEMELRENIQELTNAKTLLEGEKCNLEYQLKNCLNELENARKERDNLIEDKKSLVQEIENNSHTIQDLNDQLNKFKKCLKMIEENKLEVERQLEKTQKQLNEAKQESIDLHKEVSEVNENIVRKNLFKELKDVENILEQDRGENDVSGSEIFKKCIQAEILKTELLLRERIEKESVQKMQNIEQQYKNVLAQRTEIYTKDREKWKNQEAKYRKQFAAVLEECGRKIEELERENIELMKQANALFQEYKTFRTNAIADIEKYKKLIIDYQKKIEAVNKNWTDLFEFYSRNIAIIQKQSQKKIKNLKKTINMSETEINLIENIYNEKIKQIQLEWKNKSKNQ